MGYDLHITRADDWSQNDGKWITVEEWLRVVADDPELTLREDSGMYFTVWTAHPTDPEAWIAWSDGDLFSKYPDGPLIDKMVAIAKRLNAKVQGDDGEEYPDGSRTAVPGASRGGTKVRSWLDRLFGRRG